MGAKKPQLTPLEWEIMRNIWKFNGPVSVRQVLSEAYPDGEKAYTTVQTVMNKLFQKGFLKRQKIGMVNFYQPAKKQSTILRHEIQQFAQRTFGGSLPALVNFLFETDSLSAGEIASLKQLIEDKSKSGGAE